MTSERPIDAALRQYNADCMDDPRRWLFWSAAMTLIALALFNLWNRNLGTAALIGFTTSLCWSYPTFMRMEAIGGFAAGWRARERVER